MNPVSKLEEVKSRLQNLKSYKEYSERDFEENRILRKAMEREFQETLESCLDLAEMLSAEEGLERGDDYDSTMRNLSGEVVDDELSLKLAEMAKFRNVLVHSYATLDLHRVMEHLHEDLDDLDEYVKQVARYLLETGRPNSKPLSDLPYLEKLGTNALQPLEKPLQQHQILVTPEPPTGDRTPRGTATRTPAAGNNFNHWERGLANRGCPDDIRNNPGVQRGGKPRRLPEFSVEPELSGALRGFTDQRCIDRNIATAVQ